LIVTESNRFNRDIFFVLILCLEYPDLPVGVFGLSTEDRDLGYDIRRSYGKRSRGGWPIYIDKEQMLDDVERIGDLVNYGLPSVLGAFKADRAQ
jgi:hypothetical protein